MKNKIVIWGSNAENEKVLIALELKSETSKVLVHVIPESIMDDAFAQKMMQDWRDGNAEVTFPEGSQTLERELSITDSILPEGLKVDRTDLVQRAQTEWHFIVLSDKLYAAYKQELAEFKEKIDSLSTYDNTIFTSLRSFWDKVQNQSRERNLYRQHADELRDGINALFEHIKLARKRVNSEFNEASKSVYSNFSKALDEIEESIASGSAKFGAVFDELKKMQREYHNTRMSNEHRNKLWERLDAAFKRAKERKFGPEVNAGTVADRHDKRLSGLEDAIKRLEESLRRDDEELAFQREKVNASEGQLEAQIRGAKIKMIEERVNGKRERLAELTKARADVQRQANTAHEKEARIAAKEAERQQIEAKKAAIKSEIEAETHAKAEAAAASPATEKEESILEAASNLLSDVLLDALDTAKAVASVAADKAEEAIHQFVDKAEEALESFRKEEDKSTSEDSVSSQDTPGDALPLATQPASAEASAGKAAAENDSIIIDDVVHKTVGETEGMESFKQADTAASTENADSIIIDDVVHKRAGEAEGMESFKQEDTAASTENADSIIIDDVVHKSIADAGLESTQSEAPIDKPKRAAKKKADA
ncbi:MAG: hypothetical protein ACKVT2_06420 [Saprospiraceae bacterium]